VIAHLSKPFTMSGARYDFCPRAAGQGHVMPAERREEVVPERYGENERRKNIQQISRATFSYRCPASGTWMRQGVPGEARERRSPAKATRG